MKGSAILFLEAEWGNEREVWRNVRFAHIHSEVKLFFIGSRELNKRKKEAAAAVEMHFLRGDDYWDRRF